MLEGLFETLKVQYAAGLEFNVSKELFGALKTLIFFGLICITIEILTKNNRDQKIFRTSILTDIIYAFITPVSAAIGRILIAAPIAILCFGFMMEDDSNLVSALSGFGPIAKFSSQGVWQSLVVFLIVLLIADFLIYWTHRALHSKYLWRFHAIHHSAEELDWLITLRNHPLQILFIQPVRMLPILLLGFPVHLVLLVGILHTALAFLSHTNVNWAFGPLKGVFVSPQHHSWHHVNESHEGGVNVNFAALLVFWDKLFGTYYGPEFDPATDKSRRFGTISDPVPSDLAGQLIFPFEALFKKVFGRTSSSRSEASATEVCHPSRRP